MTRRLWMVLVGCMLSFPVLQAQSAAPSKKFVVDIDSPDFRKLVMAVPVFVTDGNKGEVYNYAIRGSKELSDLLTFSQIFNVMKEDGYASLTKKMGVFWKQNKSQLLAPKGAATIVTKMDLPQWRAIGVESLTVADLSQTKEGFELAIWTVDTNKREVILGKRYSNIQAKDFSYVMRRYADLLLEAYTGKPGIFSSKIAFAGRRNKKDAKQIFTCDFDGSNVVQITNGNYPHLSPAWSQDGKFITYTSFRDGKADIYLYDVKLGKHSKLAGWKGVNSGAVFSPDDKIIVFSGARGDSSDLYTMTPKPGAERQIFIEGSGLDVDPTFSPDGKFLAFASGRFGNPHLFQVELDWIGPGKIRVVKEKRLTFRGWYNTEPAYSPDGKTLAFASYDFDIKRFDLFILDPLSEKPVPERLTLKTGDNENPSWSPNSQLIAFHSNRTNGMDVKSVSQLYLMNRDGSGQRVLPTGLYEARTPKWSKQLNLD